MAELIKKKEQLYREMHQLVTSKEKRQAEKYLKS